MILVSFSSAEDALSNDVKKYTTFRMQGTENPPFRFFGTPGILSYVTSYTTLYIRKAKSMKILTRSLCYCCVTFMNNPKLAAQNHVSMHLILSKYFNSYAIESSG